MNFRKALVWAIAVLTITAAIVGVAQIIKGPPPAKELILKTVELRKTTEQVAQAKLITEMDGMVQRLESPELFAQWTALTSCLAKQSCTDDDYFNLVFLVAAENPESVPHAKLITDLITTNRYWNDKEHLVEFSKSLTAANEQIGALQTIVVKEKWEEIIACAGKCGEFHDLFYEITKLILQVE